MKLKSALVGALALATTFGTLASTSPAGANSNPAAGAVQTTQQYTGTKGVPLKGDFNGDGRQDVFWYVAGSGADALWLGKALNDTNATTKADRFTMIPKSISGTYSPFVGDFNGDGRSDIFWFGPGTAADSIWFGADGGLFRSANLSIGGTYTPVVGNFNTTGASAAADDVFWYNSGGSHLWSGSTSGFTTQTYAVKPPAGAKVYAGNWRQTPTTSGAAVHQDLLFYVPGTKADTFWVGNGTGTFTQSAVTINGNYDPIIGNFGSSAAGLPVMTDIFWYAPGTASDSIWMNTGSGFANVKQTVDGVEKPVVVNGKSYKPVVIPNKTLGQPDDIYWNVPTGAGETIWNLSGSSTTFAYNVVNLSTFGGSDPGARTPLVGDFDVMDATTSTAVVNSKIAAGEDHTCAITPAGGVQCWGFNGSGQLGNGTTTSSTTPVDVSGLTGVTALSAGANNTCAVTSTGGVKCWGANGSGQLGNGTTTSSTTPVDVTGLSSGVASIDVGGSHACAVLATGGARCWGINTLGQLGTGNTTASSVPVAVNSLGSVTSISAGYDHTCAVNNGSAYCWGANWNGQIGSGNTTQQNSPVLAVNGNVAQVGTGSTFSCALTTSGGAKCWGSDGVGQQGNGSGSSSNVLTAADVPGLSGYSTLLVGGSHACVRTVAGNGACWGGNTYGQFGNGTTSGAVSSPAAANLAAGYVAQSVFGSHACGVFATGTVRCWGANGAGQFGDGTSGTSSASPVAITSTLFNVDSPNNPASSDIFFVSLGDAAAQKELIWTQLGNIAPVVAP